MDIAKKLAELAVDEAWGACRYARMAVTHRPHPNIAATIATITDQELAHSEMLLAAAESVLSSLDPETDEYKATSAVMDYIRDMQAEKVNEAKRYLAQYRGM